MRYRIRTVDVFTERPFAGNQLAVVLGADRIATEQMQAIAREMNISETTFVLPADQAEVAARVRIFTPTSELPFAGHPTVGTAWVLLEEGLVRGGAAEFVLQEGVGPVPIRVDRSSGRLVLWMRHPAVSFGQVLDDRAGIAGALGLREADLLPEVPVQVVSTGVPFLFVGLRDARAVDQAVSSAERLGAFFASHEPQLVFMFASVGPNRLYSRMFAPHVLGISEDAATGSASGPLGAFAVRYGLVPRAVEVAILSEQGTKMGRQSFVHIRLTYSNADTPSRIEVGGSVVPVLSGEIAVET